MYRSDPVTLWQERVAGCSKCMDSGLLPSPCIPFFGMQRLDLKLAIVGATPLNGEKVGCLGLCKETDKSSVVLVRKLLEILFVDKENLFLTSIQKCPTERLKPTAINTCSEQFLARELKTPCPRWLVPTSAIYRRVIKNILPGKFLSRQVVSDLVHVDFYRMDPVTKRRIVFAPSPGHAVVRNFQQTWLEDVVRGITG